MVKCAKVLVYCAGERESYGKDAEAAMALSLGKPVIFYCDQEQRRRFYRDVHPLSRLIEFETGIAVGTMVTDKLEDVSRFKAAFRSAGCAGPSRRKSAQRSAQRAGLTRNLDRSAPRARVPRQGR